jgi:MBG domain/Bacterial Ig-like domain
MRTKLRSKVTLLIMTCALLLAVPAIAALADTLIISNSVTVNQNVTKTPGDTGTANVTLNVTNGTPDGDTNGCNANGSNPVTATLSSNNSDVTFPSGNTATITGCGVAVPVSYKVDSNSNGGTAVISASVSGGVPSTIEDPRKYDTTDTLTVTIPDIKKPTVTAVTPEGQSVPVNTTVTATFSEAMKATTINNTTFTLKNTDADSSVQAGVVYDADTKIATLTPQNSLAHSTNYEATVTTGAQDLAGNALDQDGAAGTQNSKTWSFKTAPPPCTVTSSVTTQPQNATATYGDSSVSFTAAANGSPAPSVQWQVNTGTGFTDIAGANDGTLTINNPTVSQNNNQYRAVFTNTCNGTNIVNSNAATLTVNKATADVQLNNLTHTYDGTAKGASATTTPSGLNVNFAYSQNGNSVANPTNAGSYDVVATVNDANYQGSANGTLTINKATATLSFATGTLSKTYNGSAQGVTVNTTPLGLSGVEITYDGSPTAPTNAGSYEVSATLDNANYEAPELTDILVIAKANPTITWNAPAAITYGTALSSTQLNATFKGVDDNTLAGTPVYDPASGTVLNAGSHTLRVDFTPTDTTNYNTAFKTVSLTVNKATPQITWSNPADIDYGTLLSSTQLNAQADVPGSFTYVPPAGTKLLSGTQSLTANFTPTDTTNYENASKTVQIVVNPYPFTGFFQPIDNGGVFNKVKLGSTVPVKFSLGGDKGLDIFAPGYPVVSKPITCGVNPVVDTVEEYAPTGTNSGLKYDAATGQYIYNWKTTDANVKAGECRQLIVKLADGSVVKTANFNFFK